MTMMLAVWLTWRGHRIVTNHSTDCARSDFLHSQIDSWRLLVHY